MKTHTHTFNFERELCCFFNVFFQTFFMEKKTDDQPQTRTDTHPSVYTHTLSLSLALSPTHTHCSFEERLIHESYCATVFSFLPFDVSLCFSGLLGGLLLL